MGHLLSRALRRITQSTTNQSRNQEQEQQSNEREEQISNKPVLAQSIPVGQSIDSAEYAAFETNNKNRNRSNKINENNGNKIANNNKENKPENEIKTFGTNDNNKQDVEEAVIKIQALVRGHLTRKALKDAHHHSLPNALGQSQFDEDSLTRNPPSTIFLTSSPLNLGGLGGGIGNTHHEQKQSSATIQSNRSPLESIAEGSESTNSQNKQSSTFENNNNSKQSNHQQQEEQNDLKKKLSPLNTRSASSPSKLEMPLQQNEFTARTPTPSEANASIDLCCETPASASIDILDHNIKPTDKIASVLHHKQEKSKESLPNVEDSNTIVSNDNTTTTTSSPIVQTSMTSDSLDSEEAAAIRIQSAFRGYRTRKNSPYRTRSPNSTTAAQAKRNALTRQQEATVLHENENDIDDHDDAVKNRVQDVEDERVPPIEDDGLFEAAQSEGRRSSRVRQREQSPIIQGAPSIEEFTTTDVTVREAQKPTTVHEIDINNRQSDTNVIDPSFSLDLSGSLSEQVNNNTLDEIGLSAALESAPTNMTTNQDQGFQEVPLQAARNFSGKESEASIELDTDSSVLGAALSLNSEDASELQLQQPSTASAPPNLDPIDEMDKSFGFSLNDELESEARRLVEELDFNQQQDSQLPSKDDKTTNEQMEDEKALDEATLKLGSVMEQATANIVDSLLLDDEEQHNIELNSDDIERRDPKGYASGERLSKSPQTRSEKLKFNDENNNTQGGQLVVDDAIEGDNSGGLSVESPIIDDGQSTPAFNSSANVSSEEEVSDHEEGKIIGANNQQQQQQNRSPTGGKNKKRNNRNKKKGKK